MTEIETAAIEARSHADHLRGDIENAMTRIEHIRLTALANEAEHLARHLERLASNVILLEQPSVTH